jgi:hypothetical protein
MALTDNLVAYYKLQGNSNDSVASYNGSDTNITYGNSYGKIDQGASFSYASGSKITVATDFGFTGTYDRTFACWFKIVSFQNYSQVFSYRKKGVAYGCIFDYRNESGTYKLCFNNNGLELKVSQTLDVDTWYHLAWTFTGSNSTCYLNGNSVGTITKGSGNASETAFRIGWYGIGDERYWNGYIDEFGIWSRALTSDEISTLYNSGNGLQYPFTTTSIKSINGLAYASVKSYNGLAKASIKNINGLS